VNRTRALTVVVFAGLLLAGLALSARHHPNQPAQSARQPNSASTPPTSPPGSTTPASPGPERLLPFTHQQITAAADLATRFTAAYATHRFDETPRTYLARLTPMMSTQLQPVIAQAAIDPAILDQRRRHREITTAHAQAEAIRALGPTSITLLLTATTQTTGQQAAQWQATRQETRRYAVTVIRHDDGWQVYALELAATGDTGESGNDPNLP
jgi:hypothetical protein